MVAYLKYKLALEKLILTRVQSTIFYCTSGRKLEKSL